ncbi:hypothetical protein T11_5838, partial [Trichinella zimbabwensis]
LFVCCHVRPEVPKRRAATVVGRFGHCGTVIFGTASSSLCENAFNMEHEQQQQRPRWRRAFTDGSTVAWSCEQRPKGVVVDNDYKHPHHYHHRQCNDNHCLFDGQTTAVAAWSWGSVGFVWQVGLVDHVERNLPHLPLRSGTGPTVDRTLLLQRHVEVRAPEVLAAVDQIFADQSLRSVPIQLYHADQSEAIPQVGKVGHKFRGTAENILLSCLPRHRDHLRRLVIVRADRPHCRRNSRRSLGLAILDQADRCGDRLHRRLGVHVCPVQNVRATVPTLESLQQGDLRGQLSGFSKTRLVALCRFSMNQVTECSSIPPLVLLLLFVLICLL